MRALLCLLPLAALLAACGGDSLALDPVAQAASSTTKQGSEHVEFHATSTTPQGQTFQISGSGDFRNDPQLGAMMLTFTAGATKGSIREVLQGWRIYMTSPLFAGQLPNGKTWMSLDLQKAGKAAGIDFSSFGGQTPGAALQQLKTSSGGVKNLGEETIDGVTTTHYRATIDPKKIPNGERIQQLTDVTYEPVDVWIDSDDLVRRVHSAYSSPTTGRADSTLDFSDYGEDVDVSVPAAADTLDATSLASKGLTNGGTK